MATSARPGPLPAGEYRRVYARVPRLTVEVVVVSPEGVLLATRQHGPCRGLWHLPGGTVRFGERLTAAVERVAADELGVEVVLEGLLGYIEYPSHLRRGIDWPVGVAFRVRPAPGPAGVLRPEEGRLGWFHRLPSPMHEEQRCFLRAHGLAR